MSKKSQNKPEIPEESGAEQDQTPPANPPEPSTSAPKTEKEITRSFLRDNWDKLISIVLGGVVGFFAAITAIHSDISELKERLSSIDTRIEHNIEPKLGTLDQNIAAHSNLEIQLKALQTKEETAELVRKQIEEQLQNAQLRTLRELQKLLQTPGSP